MEEATRRGIWYSLIKSPYFLNLGKITLKFSSGYNRERFVQRIDTYYTNMKMTHEYKIKMEVDESYYNVLALNLYKDIEKRGFCVILNKKQEVITCPENLILTVEIKSKI